ncbi:DUF2218 domain-containing protein [Phaeobacter sp. QD34_3]|uniref:DUF2218 domain-containing protein n=1 Tax=unclassified Phaeobacter TaxID=2621772 RepID=UPI00237F27F6|nr:MULTISPECIES: DUF2218 domain-containing protein [unclassified Phaeobacter]MDE4134504.1 DUF2218 domain-containing protein [Phaeobacter sp. QD34_3]MDE4138163.1 DUF2218 domain-containing protein [Phaeobacter sp. QD34_24]MDE4176611.1 DUF2218 domain-containing protein [Phaeobacter sp. PT47_59]
MLRQTGRFETRHASKYLQQLCKHFAHKVEVNHDSSAGQVAFPFGPAHLRATEQALVAEISGADDAALSRGRGVIDSHLKTFAFREDFETMTWSDRDNGQGS